MAVYKRPGSPYWQIEFEYQGERVRKSSGTESKRQAEELERKWRKEIHDQLLMGKVSPMSLGDALDRYFDTVVVPRGNKEVATRDLYVLNLMRSGLGEKVEIAKLSAPVITNYRDGLLRDGKAPATVNRYLAVLKAILNKAKDEWGTLAVVPTIKLMPLDNMRYRWLTEDEEATLLSHCPPHLRDLAVFLVDTGARLSEATTLTWVDVDLDRKPRALVKFMDTKSGKPRAVPLTSRLVEVLNRAKQSSAGPRDRVLLYRPQGRGGEGMASEKARAFRRPHGAWDTACEKAGIDDVRMHDLRHTFASRLIMRGVPLLTVSKLLGHASIQMTMRYAHLAPDAFDAAIDALEARQSTPSSEPANSDQPPQVDAA